MHRIGLNNLLAAVLTALALFATTHCIAEPPGDGERFFESKIRPVLADRCYKCHSSTAKSLKAGLHLDSPKGLRKGGDSGPTVVPGKSNDSLLVHALRYDGPEMPPEGKLDPAVIADFERWVRMGAPWPEDRQPPPAPVSQPTSYDFEKIRGTHWSLLPIRKTGPPDVGSSSFVINPIDQFIVAQLSASGLTPSPPADRRTLIRRATFDLTGLPPAYAEVEAFVADISADAYERLLDRLLASPRYGERWGRHWLDIARYSDTKGEKYKAERGFPYAYTYRDYVIRALNKDLPLDRFILQQLAADLLPTKDDPQTLAALGFLTLRPAFAAPHLQIDDQIDTIGRGLLGLTVACARCHDHKYDAIPTADYYSLYGVLASSAEPAELPLLGQPANTPAYAKFKKKFDALERERTEFEDKQLAELVEHACTRVEDYLVQYVATRRDNSAEAPYSSLSRDDLRPGLIRRWREYLNQHAKADDPIFGPWYELVVAHPEATSGGRDWSRASTPQSGNQPQAKSRTPQLNPLVREALVRHDPRTALDVAHLYGKLLANTYRNSRQHGPRPAGFEELLTVLLSPNSPPQVPRGELQRYLARDIRDKLEGMTDKINAHAVHSPAAPPRAMTLVESLSPHNPTIFVRGNPSQPGSPVPRQFLRLLAGPGRQPFREGSGRLELARAIVAPDNPLTARVLVNRIWMHHMGSPLVNTPDDFGVRSDAPTNPALLDYLARWLIDGGWSQKQLHREIMLSAAYRQSSVDRPDCRRADPENRLYWRMNRLRLELEPLRDSLLAVAGQLDETMYGQPVNLTKEPLSRRRAIYGRVDRHELGAIFRTFDFSNPQQCTVRRPQTIVPQQTLFMMNTPFVIEQARAVAARKEVSAATGNERIQALYRAVLSRDAKSEELETARTFVENALSASEEKLTAWEQLAQVLLMTNEFVFVD